MHGDNKKQLTSSQFYYCFSIVHRQCIPSMLTLREDFSPFSPTYHPWYDTDSNCCVIQVKEKTDFFMKDLQKE